MMKAHKTISLITALLVLFLATAAFVLSFDALRSLAGDNGVKPGLTWLIPLVVDGAIIAFSLSVLRASLYGEPATWPWVLVIGFTVLSIVYNVSHAPAGILSRIVAATPPIALFLSFETFMGQLKAEVKRSVSLSTLSELTTAADNQRTEMDNILSELDRLTEKRNALKAEITALRDEKRGSFAPTVHDLLDKANGARSEKIEDRRKKVLAMMVEGRSVEDIAAQLGVSEKTVRRDVVRLNGRAQPAITEG